MVKEYVEERSGGYYAAGTRVSLDSIVECFDEGMSAETIRAEFETLTPAQVSDILTSMEIISSQVCRLCADSYPERRSPSR